MKFVILVGLILLFVNPIIMMIQLSKKEMEQCKQYDIYQFNEVSYGVPCEVKRQDIEQYYSFSGAVTSDTYQFIEFNNDYNSTIKIVVCVGDEVQTGEVVAYAGSQKIISKYNGIVEEILAHYDGYIKLRTFDNLKLECMADQKIINKIKDCNSLSIDGENKVTIDYISKVSVENKVKIVFQIVNSKFIYGQKVQEIRIYTDQVFKDVLVVDKDCVYQLEKDGPYFVRTLTKEGYFDNEVEVEVGFETDEVVSIVNVSEGTLCDSGYKALVQENE